MFILYRLAKIAIITNNMSLMGNRVLLIETADAMLQSHGTQLSQAGFKVEKASNAREAVELARTGDFALFIADLGIPQMNGLDLLRQIRQYAINTQALLLLDRPDNELVVESTRLGGLQCLVKPVKPELLVKAAMSLAKTAEGALVSGGTRAISIRPTLKRTSVSASEAKNKFSQVLEKAIQGNAVFITKHESQKAVLISVDNFDELSRIPESKIDRLSAEFDNLLARMQEPKQRKAMEKAFHASPEQLGHAAVRAVRKRV